MIVLGLWCAITVYLELNKFNTAVIEVININKIETAQM